MRFLAPAPWASLSWTRAFSSPWSLSQSAAASTTAALAPALCWAKVSGPPKKRPRSSEPPLATRCANL
eukprot:2727135-Pyramimonas_sp.AAC.1